MNLLSINIKQHRKSLNISQIDLAERLNVSQTSVAHYENGKRIPTLEVIMKMAMIFNISIDTLLGYKGALNPLNVITDIEADKEALFNDLIQKDYYQFHQRMMILAKQHSMAFMIDEIVKEVLYKIGLEWQKGTITVADEHYASKAISRTMAALYTLTSPVYTKKKAIAMAVGSEEHTLGIELISNFLQTHGIETWYLGSHVPITSLNQMIEIYKPDYLFLSITLRQQMNTLELMLQSLTTKRKLKIFLGGQGIPFIEASILKMENIQIIENLHQLIEIVKEGD